MTKIGYFVFACRILHPRIYFFIITFLLSTLAYSYAYSQAEKPNLSTKISVSAKDAPLKKVLSHIESQSGFIFVYYDSVVDDTKPITIEVKDKPVYDVLNEISRVANVSYNVSERQIVLSAAPARAERTSAPVTSGNITVRGNVTDISGEPIIGAVVLVRDNKELHAVTDAVGNYSITVPDRYAVLVFSHLSYINKEEVVGSRQIINVVLQEDQGQLEEVVVVGYGVQKKVSVVGAVTTISPNELRTGTTRSLSNNLAGNLAGIIGVQRSGEPGYDNSDFWIRGISTFKSQRNPLILIDGIERSINDIDIAEIETFSVLKDASASAVYGVRGANGVILITTKRGQAGPLRINFAVEHSITCPVQLPSFLGSANYLTLLNNINLQDKGVELYSEDMINKYRNRYDPEIYPDVDWLDAITRNLANNTRASFDINGGSERLRYSVVGVYYNEKGITQTDKRQNWDSSIRVNRYNLRTNVDMNVTKSTLVSVSLGGYLQRRNSPAVSISDLFNQAFATPPYSTPIQYKDGRLPKAKDDSYNPWANLTQTGFYREAASKFESVFAVEQDMKNLVPGLKAKVIFSFDYYSRNWVRRDRTPNYFYTAIESDRDPETGELNLRALNNDGQEFLSHSTGSSYGNNSTYLEGNITYNRDFGKHNVSALLLYNQRDYNNGDMVPYRNQGFAGRAAYNYDQKYIVEFNFGYNGSENFAKGNRFGFFPSIAAGWIVTQENFMESTSKWLNHFKIRASYGLVGNDQLDRRFAYITTISNTDGYKWGTSSTFYQRSGKREGDVGVSDLTWETVAKLNVGLELGLFRVLNIQVDVFNDKRRDIFMQRNNFPNSAGFINTPWANFGKVNNRGIDVSVDFNKQVMEDWFVSVRGNFTYAKNKILEQDESQGVVGTYRSGTGKPVGQIFGLIAEGLYTEEDFADLSTGLLKEGLSIPTFVQRVYPGDIKYRDLDNDGFITSMDMTAVGGTVNPEIVYGFGLSTRYRNIDFGVFFQGNGRTYRMIGRSTNFLPGALEGTSGNIYSNAADNAWTEANPRQDTFYPRLHMGPNENNSQASTWWLKNMSMLRLKNVEIGYTFPKTLMRKASISHARIFCRGTNLLKFSKFKLWDPELGTDNGLQYPIMKTYSMGLELRF